MSMLIGCLLFSGLIRAEEEPQAKFFASQALGILIVENFGFMDALVTVLI